MPELLLEVGCEELPATFVRKAYSDLHDRVGSALGELYGGTFAGVAMGTPRRLIVSFPDIPSRQPDSSKEVRGPALKAAYDDAGNPSQALLGFCRSNGAEPSQLRKDENYVWLTKAAVGLPTAELLVGALPKAIKGLTFEKSMRWGSARLRFARPLRWLLASFDGKVVEFEIEGVRAGLESRGHRFYAPESFTARTLDALVSGLRERKVEPDAGRRVASIVEAANKVAGGTPDLPDDLVDENGFLTEWPAAIAGEFRAEHLGLPGPVLTTAMAKHEKMFPVRDSGGKLLNRFVFIRNSGEDDSVRRGAEWVLNARLDDAQFFFKEDAKHDLDYFLEKTSGIVFQENLGTVRERADRLEALAGIIAEQTGATAEEVKFARLAGKYAKADLSTGLVSDMASLQGIVGGEYARRMGMPDPVCWAIRSHYDHELNPTPTGEGARTALRLTLADNLEKLVGYLGLGLVPSGSSDPFGLRRSATAVIQVALRWPETQLDVFQLVSLSTDRATPYAIPTDGVAAIEALLALFPGRYEALHPEVRYDVLEAATHREDLKVLDPRHVRCRIGALTKLAEDIAFVQTATRPLNILAAAKKKHARFGLALVEADPPPGVDVERWMQDAVRVSDLDSAEGVALFAATQSASHLIKDAFHSGDWANVILEIRKLESPINVFFEATMIMAEDPCKQHARLTLVKVVSDVLYLVGDFSKLVIEG